MPSWRSILSRRGPRLHHRIKIKRETNRVFYDTYILRSEVFEWLRSLGGKGHTWERWEFPDSKLVTFAFENGQDAMLFKLTWGGK